MTLNNLLTAVAVSVLFTFSAVGSALAEDPVDAGRVRIRNSFDFAGTTFQNGRYTVQLQATSDGTMIVLAQDGSESLRELAIVIEEKGNAKKARSSASVVGKDEKWVRVRVRSGMKSYLIFFPVVP